MSTRTKKTAVKAPKGVTPPTAMGGRSGFLSDVIVELGFATRDTVEQAVRAARSPGTTVARVLVDMGAISEEQLAHATAERYGIDYIDLEGFDLDPAAANLIKPTAAKRYQAVPVGFLGKGLLVAMADPADALGVNDIAVMTKLEVRPAVAARPALDALLESLPLDEFGYDEAPAAKAATQNGDAPEVAAEPAEEPAASAAVFWQEGAGDELPDAPGRARRYRRRRLAAARRAQRAQGAARGRGGQAEGQGEGGRRATPPMRRRLEELRARLAEAEAELEEARGRVRESKEVSAELETLREALAAAEQGLDEASARAREGDAVSAEAEGLRGQLADLKRERDEARTAGKDADRLRERVDAVKAERDEARARARETETELRRIRADVDVRSGELETLRTKLTESDTELVRVRAEVDTRGSELEAMRTRAESAEAEAESALRRADAAQHELEEAQREAAELAGLREELEGADARAEQARHALTQLREETEREREQWAVAERDIRESLADEETRRAQLEGRLSEVETSAFAAERAFEELRLAQRRMRGALREPGGPDEPAERSRLDHRGPRTRAIGQYAGPGPPADLRLKSATAGSSGRAGRTP